MTDQQGDGRAHLIAQRASLARLTRYGVIESVVFSPVDEPFAEIDDQQPGEVLLETLPSWREMCERVAEQLAIQHTDPFVLDTVIVPSAGHQRALSQFLASRELQGICAGIEFTTLPALRRDLAQEYLDISPHLDPWRPRDLTVAIIKALDAVKAEPWFEPLAHHLDGCSASPTTGHEKNRRAVTARRISTLYRGYWEHCPELIDAWREGRDVGPDGSPLAPDQQWQAKLWRELRDSIRIPDPLSRHYQLYDALFTQPWTRPGRMFALTVSRNSQLDAELLFALTIRAGLRRWQLGLPVETRRLAGGGFTSQRPGEVGAAQSILLSRYATDAATLHIDPPAGQTSLQKMQADVRADRAPAGRYRADGSVQIHLSHGPERQVEVLREVLTGIFQDKQDLQPREVLILSPQLDRYSAHLRACFAPAEVVQHPGQTLRAQLSGSSTLIDNPILDLVRRLLALPDSRAFTSDLIELISQPAVLRRFALRNDDVDELAALLDRANASWGIDAKHRRSFGVSHSDGTWWQSIERMLLGLVLDSSSAAMVGGTVPIDSVRSDDMHRVGSLAEVVSRIRSHLLEFEQPATAAVWAARLRAMLADLTAVDSASQWQMQQALGVLADWETTSLLNMSRADVDAVLGEIDALDDLDGWLVDVDVDPTNPPDGQGNDHEPETFRRPGVELSAAEVLAMFEQWAPRAVGRPNFGNGTMLVGALGELQAVEHRVIVLLGVDDDIFPTRFAKVGDDLLGGRGNDQRRLASRQQFLDAMLAAQDAFIVISQGADERTNARLPEPVAVLDLMTALGRSVSDDAAADPDDAIIRRHGLQAHSWSNFTSEIAGRPFSFDDKALAGAIQLSDPQPAKSGQSSPWQWRFPEQPWDEELTVAQLADFLRNPARFLLRDVQGLYLRGDLAVERESLPLQQSALDQYAMTDAMLEDLLTGASPQDAISLELGRGRVLRNQASWQLLTAKNQDATAIYQRLQQARSGQLEDVDCVVDLDLASGPVRLTARVRSWDDQIVHYTAGSANENRRIQLWLELLMAAASRPQGSVNGLLVARSDFAMRCPDADLATRLLSEIVQLRHAAKHRVVPLPVRTARVQTDPPSPWQDRNVRSAWRGSSTSEIPGDHEDPYWRHFFIEPDDLFGVPSLDDDPLPYQSGRVASRFVQLSRWLFDPMNAHERRLP